MKKIDVPPQSDRELAIAFLIDAPADKLYRAWTEPELLKQWFCPKPWGVSDARMEVRAGGSSSITMRGPEGQVVPNLGVYLEVIPGRKLVFTDAFTEAWKPSDKPFMVGTVTFEPEGDKTRYTARVRHWSVADREAHEKMGFSPGWTAAAQQLEDLLKSL